MLRIELDEVIVDGVNKVDTGSMRIFQTNPKTKELEMLGFVTKLDLHASADEVLGTLVLETLSKEDRAKFVEIPEKGECDHDIRFGATKRDGLKCLSCGKELLSPTLCKHLKVRRECINDDHGDYRHWCYDCGKCWVTEGPDS